MRSAHDEIKYECAVCHATFSHKHSLARHKRTHDPQSPTENAASVTHTPNNDLDSAEPTQSLSQNKDDTSEKDQSQNAAVFPKSPSSKLRDSAVISNNAVSPKSSQSRLSKSQSILDKFLGGIPPRISFEKADTSTGDS